LKFSDTLYYDFLPHSTSNHHEDTMSEEKPSCTLCGQPLTDEEVEQCEKQAERFSNQYLCFAHQRRFCGCPGVRSQTLP
jgi:hypothetical protein